MSRKELIETINIKSNPDTVWDTLVSFLQNTDSYKSWHEDHISIRWKKGETLSPGSILVAKERINGRAYTIAFQINTIDQANFLIEYTILFPFSLVCSSGYFQMSARGEMTEFTAQLRLRGGAIIQKLFKRDIESLRLHMQEEGENIKKLIDAVSENDANKSNL